MASTPAQSMAADEKKWKAQNDMRTLVEAEQIKADKPRYKAALAMATQEKKNLDKIKAS